MVLEWLLNRFLQRPAVILLEINPAFPPPFEFAVEHHAAWDRPVPNATHGTAFGHLAYGCSLSHVVRLLASVDPHYILLNFFKKDLLIYIYIYICTYIYIYIHICT